MQSEKSRTVRVILDFQHPFLPFQVFLVQQGRGDGAGFDEVARLAGVVVVGALLVGQLVLGMSWPFSSRKSSMEVLSECLMKRMRRAMGLRL